jgi:hypothetical protein
LYTYGFIKQVLSLPNHQSNVTYREFLDTKVLQASGREILDDILKLPRKPIFLLDECLGDSKELKLVRKVLLSLRIGLVLLGTNSHIANIPNTVSKSSQSRGGDNTPWCYIISKYPKFIIDSAVTINWTNSTKRLIFSSRPWFAKLAVEALQRHRLTSINEECLTEMFNTICNHKKLFLNIAGILGQFRMFLNVYYKLPESPISFIDGHFATLSMYPLTLIIRLVNEDQIEAKQYDEQTNQWIIYSSDFKFESKFSNIEDDPLLYLPLIKEWMMSFKNLPPTN